MPTLTDFGNFKKRQPKLRQAILLTEFNPDGMSIKTLVETLTELSVSEKYDELRLKDLYVYADGDEYSGIDLQVFAEYEETKDEFDKRMVVAWREEKKRIEALERAVELQHEMDLQKIKEQDLKTLHMLAKKYGKEVT